MIKLGITRVAKGMSLLLLALFCLSATKAWSQMPGQKKLIIAHSAKYPPFSFLDEQRVPRGYIIDVWTAFSHATGIQVSFKLGSWQESLDMVKNGEADVHGGLFYNENRDGFLDFGPTITQLDTILFQHKSLTKDEADELPIGVVKGGFAAHFIAESFPGKQLVLFDSTMESIAAARSGSIKIFAADAPTGIFYLRKFKIQKSFTDEDTLYSMPLQIAVKDGDTATMEIIQQGWPKLDSATHSNIDNKWFVRVSSYPDWLIPIIILALAGLCCAIVIRSYCSKQERD